MNHPLRGQVRIRMACLKECLFGTMLFFVGNTVCLADIVLHGNQVITTPTSYNHQTLDLTDGRFTVNPGGSLDIENSTINITISSGNPYFVLLNSGQLTLKNNAVNVKAGSITPNPSVQAAYQLMTISNGQVNIATNTFSIDTPFTVGLLSTQTTLTSGFQITGNTINSFHGGLYLSNSNNAEVDGNVFSNVSYANIFNMGNLNNFNHNLFSFPGNLNQGDAIDIVNSNGVTIAGNIIASGSNYGISVMGGQNLFIENNKITDGLSYGIIIQTPSMAELRKNKSLSQLLAGRKFKLTVNSNIVITNNYIAQNKYGLTGGVIDKLIVTNNMFIQRFTDSSIRQYWTNNDNLLPSVTNLTWLDNQYKEAFTQDNAGDNTPSLQFVTFPAHGGVFIP